LSSSDFSNPERRPASSCPYASSLRTLHGKNNESRFKYAFQISAQRSS
jgi:hypothetical protein